MLAKGKIPATEPLIRVGIFLPEDQMQSVTIDFPDPDNYRISPRSCWPQSKTLTASIENGQLIANGREIAKITIQRNALTGDYKQPLIVHNVTAGRGFHWKKSISSSLLGDLEIRVADGNMLVINELPLEQYLSCVATSEMSAECPAALIESQTIVARAWMLANVEQKHRKLGFDVCNDDCCQRYHGTGFLTPQAITGAQATRGQVIMNNDQICDARYSKSCGGMMETFESVWGGSPLPYMQNIFDADRNLKWDKLPLSAENNARDWIDSTPNCFCSPQVVPEKELTKYIGGVDEAGRYFRWQFDYSQAELNQLLNQKLQIDANKIIDIKVIKRGGSGRLIDIKIEYLDSADVARSIPVHSEYNIRQTFHPSFLYSSAFYIEKSDIADNIPDKFSLYGAGWGHGAGLCQIGALGMALQGYKTAAILRHYYPGSRLVTIYS